MLHETCIVRGGRGDHGVRVDKLVDYPEGDFVDQGCDDEEGINCLGTWRGFIEFVD